MTGRAFLDTNVVVYAFDRSDLMKREVAIQLLRDADLTQYVVSAQVLSEVYVTVTRKLAEPLSPDEAEAVVERLAKLEVVPITSDLVQLAIARAAVAVISYWDALIVEAARRAGCEAVLTEDLNAGQDFDGVAVRNPFAAS